MTLDEMEEFAKATRSSDPNHQGLILARAVLALLPVVRAAEAWHESLAEPNGGARRIKEHEALWALRCRLDTMRAALGGDKRP